MCMALACSGAFAQQGEKAAGLNLSYGSKIKNLSIGVKGQYGITNDIRLEGAFDYFLEKNGMKMWDINANVHYLFPVTEQIKVYPLAGLSYSSWNTSTEVFSNNDDNYENSGSASSASTGKIGINLGVGGQYELNEKVTLNAELKYQLISDFSQVVFGVGVAYKF